MAWLDDTCAGTVPQINDSNDGMLGVDANSSAAIGFERF
jgi:hypothetical protein